MNPTLLWIIKYKYLVLFPLAVFQGSLFALAVGFLVRLGVLGFLPAYGVLVLGDVVPDTAYYFIGRLGNKAELRVKFEAWLAKKYGARFRVISGSFALLEKLWRDHPRKTMFFGKLATGLATPILISAGLVKMSYRRFISLALPTTLVLYGIFVPLGYYLGSSYVLAERYVRDAGLLVAVAFVIIIGIYAWLNRLARAELTKMDRDEK